MAPFQTRMKPSSGAAWEKVVVVVSRRSAGAATGSSSSRTRRLSSTNHNNVVGFSRRPRPSSRSGGARLPCAARVGEKGPQHHYHHLHHHRDQPQRRQPAEWLRRPPLLGAPQAEERRPVLPAALLAGSSFSSSWSARNHFFSSGARGVAAPPRGGGRALATTVAGGTSSSAPSASLGSCAPRGVGTGTGHEEDEQPGDDEGAVVKDPGHDGLPVSGWEDEDAAGSSLFPSVDPSVVVVASPHQVWVSKTRRALRQHRREQVLYRRPPRKNEDWDARLREAGGATTNGGDSESDVDDVEGPNGSGGAGWEWELEPCLHYWCHRRPATRESVAYAFQVLGAMLEPAGGEDHSVEERDPRAHANELEPSAREAQATAWLNMALDHWRVGIVEGHIGAGSVQGTRGPGIEGTAITVGEVWKGLRVVGPWRRAASTKSYGLLLSAVAAAAAVGSDVLAMPKLANAILDHCLDETRRGNPRVDANAAPPVLWNTAMLTWAKAIHPKPDASTPDPHAAAGAVQLVLALLGRMKESGVAPSQVTYATVLYSISNAAATVAASAESTPSPRKFVRRPQRFEPVGPVAPDDRLALDAYAEQVFEVLEEAERCLRLEPNDVCYLHALQTLVNCRRVDRAYEVLQSRIDACRRNDEDDNYSSVARDGDPQGGKDHPAAGAAPVRGGAAASVKPSRQMFGVVMSGFARQGDVPKVLSLFRDLLSLYGGTEDERRGCLATINLVLQALAEERTLESAQHAQDLLERAVADVKELEAGGDRTGIVDTAWYNTVLHGWAMCVPLDPSRCVERAEELLQAIPHPNTISYTNVIKAWARSDIRSPPAAERCMSFLDAMWEHHNSNESIAPAQAASGTNERGSHSVKPNAVTYSTVLYAWSRSYSARAPFEAEKLFAEMMDRYRNGDDEMEPTEGAYVALMTTWMRSDNRQRAASRIQFYFDHWLEHCQSRSLPVSAAVYYLVLQAKVKAGDGEGAERLLEKIVSTFRVGQGIGGASGSNGPSFARPSYDMFRLVASGLRNAKDSPDRVERLVQQMNELGEMRKWHDLKPKTNILVLLLQALAESRWRNAAERAFRVLKEMEASDDPGVKPNPQCYAEVLSAWSRSRRPEAPERALALLRQMLNQYEAGDDACRPNSMAYTAVMSSLAYSGHPDAPLKVQSLFNEMYDLHKQNGDKYERPSEYHYSALINAFAEQGDVSNAQAWVERMQTHSQEDGVEPSVGCYNGWLKAIVKSQAVDAGEQAEEVLRNAMPRSGHGSPDVATYTTCISAWNHSDKPEAADRAERLLKECMGLASDSRARPNAKTFLAYLRVVKALDAKDKADRAARAISWMRQLGVRPSYDLRATLNEFMGMDAGPDHPNSATSGLR